MKKMISIILTTYFTLLLNGVAFHSSSATNKDAINTHQQISIRGILYHDIGGVYIKGKSNKKMSFEIVPIANTKAEEVILYQNTFVELVGTMVKSKNKPNVFFVDSIKKLKSTEIKELLQ